MRFLIPTAEQIDRAHDLYDFDALRNSFTQGGGNIYGALGEICFGDRYPQWTKVESYNHDFERADGLTVDLKSKHYSPEFRPQRHWNVSIAETSRHQHPDFYYFVRVAKDLSKVCLLGWIRHDDFYDMATFRRKGEPDPIFPRYRFRVDCWNLPISDLEEPR